LDLSIGAETYFSRFIIESSLFFAASFFLEFCKELSPLGIGAFGGFRQFLVGV
jgi:hypothetical protein